MSYKIYENIIKNIIPNIKLNSTTNDYDITLSLNNNSNEVINIIIDELKIKFDELIETYEYTLDNILITSKNIKFITNKKYDRLHIQIELNINNIKIHIVEISFWYNGKISDEFTINDFNINDLNKSRLICYSNLKNNIIYNYYMLPLNLLVKTSFYACIDFFERRNFKKCIKYINRIKYIYDVYFEFDKNELYKNNKILKNIFFTFMTDIYKRYKMINDYPFIISENVKEIENKKLIRCIYSEYRKENRKNLKNYIKKYIKICNKKKLLKTTEITETRTDEI
jgi:hypothetical protein